MFCKNCGQETNNINNICNNCASKMQENNIYIPDKGGFKYGLLGFLFPIAGVVVYYMLKNEEPKLTHSLIIGSVISFILIAIITCFIIFNYTLLAILF